MKRIKCYIIRCHIICYIFFFCTIHQTYYEEYILTESHKGKTEAEVIAELGNPRLLAKSIIDAENATAEKTTAEPQKGMDGQETASGEYSFKKIIIHRLLAYPSLQSLS